MSQSEEEVTQVWAQLVAQSWEDADLKTRLLDDPAALLKENGVDVPEDVTVKSFEDDGNTIILPVSSQPSGEELSDDDLETVAGGLIGTNGLFLKPIKSFGAIANWGGGGGTVVYVGGGR